MAEYRLSNSAKEDLIRIHHYGVERFGMAQADTYFDMLFDYFGLIAQRSFAFEAVIMSRKVIEDVLVVQIRYTTKSIKKLWKSWQL